MSLKLGVFFSLFVLCVSGCFGLTAPFPDLTSWGVEISPRARGGLAALVSKIGGASKTIRIDNISSVSANLTIPPNIRVKIPKGCGIQGSYTVTIRGPLDAGRYPIFLQNNTVGRIAGLRYAQPEWFGAVADGVSDDWQAIQRAIDCVGRSGGGVVSLDPGKTYNHSLDIHIWASNTSLIGQHTTLRKTGTVTNLGEFFSVMGLIQGYICMGDPFASPTFDYSSVAFQTVGIIGERSS